jgi:hypothetical protein
MTPGVADARCQLKLALEIVVEHPVLPENVGCVGVKTQAASRPQALGVGIGRSRVESGPAAMRQPRLHPTVRIGAADQLRTADRDCKFRSENR